ncbi:hypothetical protein [Aliiglaciecola sp. LCG003]|uniref:hypothetical protein n=1 Tax=Aliiglaciecola sp. LCG003 TaxID=3053655 RepID=UPI0025745CE9|nr:hypothetical protein [Aliiglaciecola sp. LCG003]WJG11184.1 hypothetical protein QR722_09190 [Aliiglaciecola sp. LCG003]
MLNPREYLSTYYASDPSFDYEEGFHLNWWQHCYDSKKPSGSMLVIGGGPIISPIITAAKYLTKIDFTDYDPDCLEEVNEWIEGRGHCWNAYIRKALELESLPFDGSEVSQRAQLIKDKIASLKQYDVLATKLDESYEVVDASFVLECMSASREVFIKALNSALSHLSENGVFQGAFLNRSNRWVSGGAFHDCFYLTEDSITEIFASLGMEINKIASLSLCNDSRTGGYIFIQAKRLNASLDTSILN